MSDFPPNSRRPKQPQEEKKVERIVTGEVRRSRKRWHERMSENIFGGDGVWAYMIGEVLIPAGRTAIVDALTGGVERAVYRGGPGHRAGGYRPRGHPVPYDRFASSHSPAGRPAPRPVSRRYENFEDIIVPTRPEANDTLDSMWDLCQRYDLCTVADLYGMLGINAAFTDENRGWTTETLALADIRRDRDGWRLVLPRPERLD